MAVGWLTALKVIPWADVIDRWTTDPGAAQDDPAALRLLLVRMAADGVWAYELLGGGSLSSNLRDTLAAGIRNLLDH